MSTHITRDGVFQPDGAKTWLTGITPDFQPQKGNSTTSNSTVTNEITNGAGVNVPSEQVGFYFSGMRSATGADLSFTVSVNNTHAPTILADTMLKVNMTTPDGSSDWSSIPVPTDIVAPRADGALAWVPVGAQGAVIVIGGVEYPSAVIQSGTCTLNNTIKALDNSTGAAFMSQVSVYDVATGAWYVQPTSGEQPPQTAQACAVVASSQDNSVHNIYLYGGYDGVGQGVGYDDVWILSVPSFTWIKGYDGKSTRATHGRFAHLCAKPYPDQMIVVGGTTDCNAAISGAFADVFNLTTLSWTGAYDPATWSNYTVPTQVSNAIQATPTASMDSRLAALLSAPYAGGVARDVWYPYNSTTTLAPTPTPSPSPSPGVASSSRSWVIAVAVVVPVVVLAGLGVVAWCVWRRRRNINASSQSGRSRGSIGAWLRGQPAQPFPPKSTFSDTETTQVSHGHGVHEAPDESYFKSIHHSNVAELNSDTNSPSFLGSSLVSPRGPASPASPHSAELHSQSAYFELPGSPHITSISQNIRTHPMYPPSIGGHVPTTTAGSVSTSTDLGGSSKLPEGVVSHDSLSLPPKEMLLGHVDHPVAMSTTESPHTKPADTVHDVSPNLAPMSASMDREDLPTPETPLQDPMDNGNESKKDSHTRNARSQSSAVSDLPSPVPREQHRSVVSGVSLEPPSEILEAGIGNGD